MATRPKSWPFVVELPTEYLRDRIAQDALKAQQETARQKAEEERKLVAGAIRKVQEILGLTTVASDWEVHTKRVDFGDGWNTSDAGRSLLQAQ